jgi:hypothetical protein
MYLQSLFTASALGYSRDGEKMLILLLRTHPVFIVYPKPGPLGQDSLLLKRFKMQNLFHKICIFCVWKYDEAEGVVFNIF